MNIASRGRFFSACCGFAFLLLFCASSEAEDPGGRRGEAFTDPGYVQEMPREWREQPILPEPETEDIDVIVTLDQHLYFILSDEIRKYADRHDLTISVSIGTCGISAGKLVRKSADVGGFCCPPGETDRLPGLRFHTFGILPIALIVHPDNPIDNLPLKQARDIFQGRVFRWSEIRDSEGTAGPRTRIQPVGRLHCKLRPGHWRLLLDHEDLFSPWLQEVGTIPDMIALVAGAPGAIGYEVMMMVERYRNQGMVKAVRIDGFAPDGPNLLSGAYPLYRTLNVTTWEGENIENPRAEALVDYLLRKAKRLGESYGLVAASDLRKAGWQFKGNELVGEPQ